jgi:PAS domain S-box-containing protein
MGFSMITEAMALVCQVGVLAYTLSFFRCAYSKWAWFFISLPVVLMGVRRTVALYWMYITGAIIESTNPIPEAGLSLAISMGMIVAFIYIKKMFVHIHDLLEKEKVISDNLDVQVKERTEQLHETYKKMVRAKKQWEKTFDALPDLVTILDTEHHIVRANKSFAAALGTTPDKLVGKYCYNVVHQTDNPPPFCPAVRTMKELTSKSSQTEIPQLSGEYVISTHPIFSTGQTLVGCVHVARDVTEFTRVQSLLEEQKDRLHKIEIAKTEDMLNSARALNAGIAHELRTPLQAILNSLELICEGVKVLSGKPSELIKKIDEEELPALILDAEDRVRYSIKVLDSLSAYAKAGTSKNQHLINVVAEVELVMKTLRLTDKFKPLSDGRFSMSSDCSDECSIKINKADFMQALINLCTNSVEAIKHTDPEISIFIKCLSDRTVAIHVIDNGCGIPTGTGEALFEPYFSTKASQPDGVTNHGLGLSIVKNIVLTYSGKLSYESRPGHTDFVMTFPCV